VAQNNDFTPKSVCDRENLSQTGGECRAGAADFRRPLIDASRDSEFPAAADNPQPRRETIRRAALIICARHKILARAADYRTRHECDVRRPTISSRGAKPSRRAINFWRSPTNFRRVEQILARF
jgi:hypothetical protein